MGHLGFEVVLPLKDDILVELIFLFLVLLVSPLSCQGAFSTLGLNFAPLFIFVELSFTDQVLNIVIQCQGIFSRVASTVMEFVVAILVLTEAS